MRAAAFNDSQHVLCVLTGLLITPTARGAMGQQQAHVGLCRRPGSAAGPGSQHEVSELRRALAEQAEVLSQLQAAHKLLQHQAAAQHAVAADGQVPSPELRK
jgi:hypothetical protein